MEIRSVCVFTLCAVQLLLVCAGAASVDFSDGFGSIGKALAYYSELSGAGSSYGFFAPGVGGQIRARFELIDARGVVTYPWLARSSNHEAVLRIGNIIDQFQMIGANENEEERKQLQRSLSASLAAKMFVRFPMSRQVGVYLDNFEPVSMKEFRLGRRPEWTPLYEARFLRSQRVGAVKR